MFQKIERKACTTFLNESWPRLKGVGFLLLQRRAAPLFLNRRSLFCQTFGLLIYQSSNSAMSSMTPCSTTPFLTHFLHNVIISPFPSRWSPAIRCRPAATPVAPALTQSQVVTLSHKLEAALSEALDAVWTKSGKAAGDCGCFFNMLKRTVERTEHSCEGCQRGFFMCRHTILQFFHIERLVNPK